MYLNNVLILQPQPNSLPTCHHLSYLQNLPSRRSVLKPRIFNGVIHEMLLLNLNMSDLLQIHIEINETEQMLADFYTKPLQGSLFKKFRRVLMGYDDISVLKEFETSKMKERVGKSVPKKCAPKSESSKLNESCKNDVEMKDSHENMKICPNNINIKMKDSLSELEPQDENETNGGQVIINEVNSPYSQAAILQAAPSLMSIRSCFVSSPSQASHPPTYPAIGKHLNNHQTPNSKLQKKTANQTSHQQQNSSAYRSNESSKNSVQQPMPISHSSIGNLQQTQSQPHLSSPCYSSQPFLAASNGNNPYKKQPPMPSQTVLQYKNGVLQLTSISGGQYGPRGMSSSADKLTLSATHHNSNTS